MHSLFLFSCLALKRRILKCWRKLAHMYTQCNTLNCTSPGRNRARNQAVRNVCGCILWQRWCLFPFWRAVYIYFFISRWETMIPSDLIPACHFDVSMASKRMDHSYEEIFLALIFFNVHLTFMSLLLPPI